MMGVWRDEDWRRPTQHLQPRTVRTPYGRALPLVVLAGACGLAVLALLAAGRPKGSRVIAALGVAAVVWGWGVARYRYSCPAPR
jgi:hypothetical protein